MKTRHAMILAAGLGSRLSAEEGHKILAQIGGKPLIDYHLENFSALGVETLVIVTGHMNEELESQLEGWETPGIDIEFAFNPEYELSNGISVLAGTDVFDGPFWLVMSDHIFEPVLAPRLLEEVERFEREVEGVLGVDYKLETIFDMPDANKLRFEHGELDAIGKEIEPFGCVDVGLFWCGDGFVEALEDERDARGDCSTSDAVRRLSAAGEFEFWDVRDALWQDVDTPGARKHAEKLVKEWRNS